VPFFYSPEFDNTLFDKATCLAIGSNRVTGKGFLGVFGGYYLCLGVNPET